MRQRCVGIVADSLLACRCLGARASSAPGSVVMLAVGIALASSIFALVDPFLSRPLPYARADRLVLIDIALPMPGVEVEYPLLADWQERTDLFDGLAAFTRLGSLRVRVAGGPVALEATAVSRNFFRVLGTDLRGDDPDAVPIGGNDAWITEATAQARLAGMEVVGRTLPLQPSGSLRIRGELPAAFLMPDPQPRGPVDVLVELEPGRLGTSSEPGVVRLVRLVGRMRDGMDPTTLEAMLNAEAAARGFRVTAVPLASAMKASHRTLAAGALATGILVLCVCAANTAGRSLTRGLYRVHQLRTLEILGADYVRILRLLLMEAMIVASTAVVAALALLTVLLEIIGTVVPPNFVVLGEPGWSQRLLVFVGGAGLLACTAWFLGAVVAWRHGSRAERKDAAVADSPSLRAVRFSLIVCQVAVTLLLLAAASLLGRSYLNLIGQDTGLAGRTLAMSVSYGPDLSGTQLRQIIEATIDELRRVPGVRTVGASIGRMVDQFSVTGLIVIGGRPAPVERVEVTPDYFEAAGMAFVSGRPLATEDSGRRGVVVNEALVARHLGGRAAIGDVIQVGESVVPIVGIVGDARRRALDEAPPAAVFLTLDEPAAANVRVTYLIDASTAAAGTWEATVRRVSSEAVLLAGDSLAQRLARSVQHRSFATFVVFLFAVATVTVTAAGLTGVVGYVVARRTREAGIRMALGANPSSIVWLMVRDGTAAIITGVAIGLPMALGLSGSISSLLYEVSPSDWAALTLATTGLIVVAFPATVLPALAAARLSPTIALREE